MKYEKIEDWLEALPAEDKVDALKTWYDHVVKHLEDINYEQDQGFKDLWSAYEKANS